jgi:hypothetical protein
MVTSQHILRSVLTRFLPSLILAMIAILIIEPLVRGHDVVRSMRGIYLPLAIAEPLLMTAGCFLALWLMRKRIEERGLDRILPHLCAAMLAMVTLGAISVISQGAHLPWIITVSIASGLVSAMVCFGIRRPQRTAVAAL